jgi:hypothetical protein
MTARRPAVVDARGPTRFPMPGSPDLPPNEPVPQVLGDAYAFAQREAPSRGHRRSRGPIAAMPIPAQGTRTETRPLDVYHVVDVSPSNAWTDPENARFLDFAYLSRKWAAKYIPDDCFIQVLFDSVAAIYPPCSPREVARDGWRNRPTPSNGGTCFAPPMRTVVQHAAQFSDRAKLVVMYSDGMGDDVAEANALLVASGIQAVLIPYGQDFPWISAGWQHTSFRISAHVDDRRRAIAQTVALAILQATGHRRTA